jgi:hypothetical protein
VIEGRGPGGGEVEARLHPLLENAVGQVFVQRVARRQPVQGLVELDGVFLDHAGDGSPDAHAHGGNSVEGKHVQMIVGNHHQRVWPGRQQVAPHVMHHRDELLDHGAPVGAHVLGVVVGEEHVRHGGGIDHLAHCYGLPQ